MIAPPQGSPRQETTEQRPKMRNSATPAPSNAVRPDGDAHTYPPPRRLFLTVFPPIMLPVFLAAADGTVVATALPAIAASLGEVERLSWVVVANLIASTIAAPAYGRLGDL